MATLKQFMADHSAFLKLAVLGVTIITLIVQGQLTMLCTPFGLIGMVLWLVFILAPYNTGSSHSAGSYYGRMQHGYGIGHNSTHTGGYSSGGGYSGDCGGTSDGGDSCDGGGSM